MLNVRAFARLCASLRAFACQGTHILRKGADGFGAHILYKGARKGTQRSAHLANSCKIKHELHVLNDQYNLDGQTRRERSTTYRLDDFVVDVQLPVNNEGESPEDIRRVFVEVTDYFRKEMDERFAMANTSLWLLMEVLSPSHPQFCDPCLLKPLFAYMLTVPIIKKDFDDMQGISEYNLT